MYVHGFSEGAGGGMNLGQTTMPVTKEEMVTIRELKVRAPRVAAAAPGLQPTRAPQVAHYSNLGVCHMKLGNIEKARDNCTKALALDPSNVKALFRRGKCHAQLNALDEAKADLEGVLARDGENREARRELRALKGRFATLKKKEQKKFAGFFDKLHAEPKGVPAAAAPQAAAPPAAPTSAAAPTAEPAATEPPASKGAHLPDADPAAEPRRAAGVDGACHVPTAEDDEVNDVGGPLGPPEPFEPSDVQIVRNGD